MFIFIGIHVYIFDKNGCAGGDVISFIVFLVAKKDSLACYVEKNSFPPPSLCHSLFLSLASLVVVKMPCSENVGMHIVTM